jgi:hypothetical protein
MSQFAFFPSSTTSSSGGGSGSTTPPSFGRNAVTQARNVYSSTNVTTSAWVQLVSSLPGQVNEIYIFDSSGQTMELGVGASGFEVVQLLISPGGIGTQSLLIPSGSRVAIKAISGTASAGEIDVNFFS